MGGESVGSRHGGSGLARSGRRNCGTSSSPSRVDQNRPDGRGKLGESEGGAHTRSSRPQRRGRIAVGNDGASPFFSPFRGRMAITCANDLDPHQRGGWAVAAAVARHHLHASEDLMAGWDTEDGTTVSATERLRAAWLVLVRSAP